MADTTASATAPTTAASDSLDEIFHGAIPVRDVAFEKACESLEKTASYQLDDRDLALVMNPRLKLELAALAEHLLVDAAFGILQETPAIWPKELTDAVRKAFDLYGVTRLANIKDDAELRAAVMMEYSEDEKGVALEARHEEAAIKSARMAVGEPEVGSRGDGGPSDQPGIDAMDPALSMDECIPVWSRALVAVSVRSVMRAISFDKAGLGSPPADSRMDPRACMIAMVPTTSNVMFSERSMPLSKVPFQPSTADDAFCCVTWRRLQPQDMVRAVCMQFDAETGWPAAARDKGQLTEEEIAERVPRTYSYMGVMDHGYLHERLPEGHPRKGRKRNTRVSDLGMRLITFARASDWVTEEYRPIYQDSLNAISGMTSHEVLSKQRNDRRTGSRRPLVLKKNRPDKLNQRIKTWVDCTLSADAIEHVIHLFQQYKQLQIGFFMACHLLGDIRKGQTLK